MTGDMADSLRAAAARVEAGDPDRFAATMATPAHWRSALWPIYAANLEIARAPWVSAEPMVGEMRLQWWVDVLEALAADGRPPAHEIGAALAAVAPAAPALAAIAEARRRDCWGEPFADGAELESYLEETSGALYAAAGLVLGAGQEAQRALRDFGAAAGAAAWLQAAPELARRGREALPTGFAEHDIAAFADRALVRLALAQDGLRRAGPAARLAMLPGWQAQAMLQKARSTPQKVAQGDLPGSEFSRRFSLLRRAFGV